MDFELNINDHQMDEQLIEISFNELNINNELIIKHKDIDNSIESINKPDFSVMNECSQQQSCESQAKQSFVAKRDSRDSVCDIYISASQQMAAKDMKPKLLSIGRSIKSFTTQFNDLYVFPDEDETQPDICLKALKRNKDLAVGLETLSLMVYKLCDICIVDRDEQMPLHLQLLQKRACTCLRHLNTFRSQVSDVTQTEYLKNLTLEWNEIMTQISEVFDNYMEV